MGRWQYALQILRSAWKHAYEAGHAMHTLIVLIAGAVALVALLAGAALHLGEAQLVILPTVAAILAMLVAMAFEAHYQMYKAELTKNAEKAEIITELRSRLAAQGPEAEKEQMVRSQLAALSHAELLAIRHVASCGQLTETQLADFCRRNGLEIVTPGMLANRVTFLTRDFALGAWSVLPLMESAVRKALAEADRVTKGGA